MLVILAESSWKLIHPWNFFLPPHLPKSRIFKQSVIDDTCERNFTHTYTCREIGLRFQEFCVSPLNMHIRMHTLPFKYMLDCLLNSLTWRWIPVFWVRAGELFVIRRITILLCTNCLILISVSDMRPAAIHFALAQKFENNQSNSSYFCLFLSI